MEARDAATDAAPETAVPRFLIREFRVEGNSILSPAEVTALVQPYAGPDRDFGDIQLALEALEEGYRRRGYTSVAVILPEQEIRDGTVLFRVVEARITAVTIEGNRHFSQENIRGCFPALEIGRTPQLHKVSENLRVMNENPAKKATVQLQGGDADDTLTAAIRINDDKFWKIGATFDNSGTSSTGDYRLGFLLQHANLFNLDHVATAQFTTAPDKADKVASYSASYRIPLYHLGDSIDIFGGYSDVDSGTTHITLGDTSASYLAGISSSGRGLVSGIRYNYNLRRFGAYEHRLIAGFDYRRYDQNMLLQIEGTNSTEGTKVAAHPFSLTYTGTYSFENGGDFSFYLGGIRNDPWGDKGTQADFNRQPGMPPADYTIFRYGATLGYPLPGDWQTRLVYNGQYTGNTLISGERLGFGGGGGGRGFEERESEGDQGYSGSFELYTPDLAHYLRLPGTQLRLVGFYDDAYLFKSHPLPGENDGRRLSSIGTGVRISWSRYFTFALDWGYALTSIPGDAATKSGDNRVHFRTNVSY
jgi:hemolysin activation/secretion protein